MFSDLPFETLIDGKYAKAADRWHPNPVDNYRLAFNKLDESIENCYALKSNLAYNMQYLEYLEKQMAELNLSDPIHTMCIKTYVVTGMSVLEGLFSNIIKSHGWWKVSEYESLGTVQANEKDFGGQRYTIKTELLVKVDQHPVQMNLDEFINRLDAHHDALQVDHLVYPALRRLKDLRNRVHLQKNEHRTDHDYNAFNEEVKLEMGAILYEILTSKMVTDLPHHFEFLKVNVTEAT